MSDAREREQDRINRLRQPAWPGLPSPIATTAWRDAVAAWQADESVHPLTCGKDSRHDNLFVGTREGVPVLLCPQCDYVQGWIPQVVMDRWRAGGLPGEGTAPEEEGFPVLVPQHYPGDSEHWLQDERRAWFRDGWNYATTQTHAIPALAKCSPAELYWAVWAIMRGAKFPDPEVRASAPAEGTPAQNEIAAPWPFPDDYEGKSFRTRTVRASGTPTEPSGRTMIKAICQHCQRVTIVGWSDELASKGSTK